MAAPPKPWERADGLRNNAFDIGVNSLPSSAAKNAAPLPEPANHVIQGAGRPPIPPRPGVAGVGHDTLLQNAPFGGGYGGLYSSPFMDTRLGLSHSPFNHLGGYSSINGFNPSTNSIVHQAESRAQGAFQSVQSVVSAVSSVSMMLESTYFALHNSFRAVLGVADQFSKLKLQLTQVATSFAIFRFIKWCYYRLKVLLGLRKAGLSEDAWANAVKKSAVEAQQKFPRHEKSSWPLVAFMAIVFGGPYLLWKMLCNDNGQNEDDSRRWANGTADHVVGECKYNFVGEREDEISVKEGQRINLAPADMQPRLRENDWLLASADGVNIGVVPANYVRILGTRKAMKAESKCIPEDTIKSDLVSQKSSEAAP